MKQSETDNSNPSSNNRRIERDLDTQDLDMQVIPKEFSKRCWSSSHAMHSRYVLNRGRNIWDLELRLSAEYAFATRKARRFAHHIDLRIASAPGLVIPILRPTSVIPEWMAAWKINPSFCYVSSCASCGHYVAPDNPKSILYVLPKSAESLLLPMKSHRKHPSNAKTR